MFDVKRILFPVDLSESSPRMVPHVITMARKFDAEVHLVFVARVFEHFTNIYVPHPSIRRFEDELVLGAQQALEEFRNANFSALPKTHATVLSGDISDEILKYIAEKKIDLLVIGSHGRKGLERVVFGSVSERVIKACPVPVLLVNPFRSGD